MRQLDDLPEIKATCRAAGASGRLGFVPTMGALHAGHLSLARAARRACDVVAVSIFVNPLQFGPGEDLERYPRTLEADARALAGEGVDLVLALRADQMYPAGFATSITQSEALTRLLEGAARPGHFDGVLTVVAKLFQIVGPCRAFFGRKDFQQTVVVRRLIADLDMPVELEVCPTVRDADGLALSSRNAYLSAEQRARGLSLVRGLADVQRRFAAGEHDRAALEAALRAGLEAGLGGAPDYAAVVDPVDLSSPAQARPGDVVVVAGKVGATRLLDNHVLGEALVLPDGSAPR